MKRIIQRDLMRGHNANRVGVLLFVGLLTILAWSVFDGVRHLRF